ncbi:MAG: DUF1080 domain-containing protein [Verrucomicrobia bacterium]|nr:DUF1080 domain-containing protein [Verrucomicrobiota bacterium]
MNMTAPFAALTLGLTLLLPASASAEESVLFNGKTDGWKMAGPGSFEINGDTAKAKGGMGLWWYEKKQFQNFTLTLQFKWDDPKWNAGVFVRFPDPANDPWVAVKQGYELQVSGDTPGKNSTGAIYDIQAAVRLPDIKKGDWNTYQITCAGPWIASSVNGQLVNIYRCQEGRGDVQGYIGIQNHDDGSPVEFRNIRIEEWPADANLLEALTSAGTPRSELTGYYAALNPQAKWFDKADVGVAHVQTFGDWGPDDNYRPEALKGIVIRPSHDPNFVALFDSENLKFSSATTGGVALDNTPWAGRHGQQNKVRSNNGGLFRNRSGAGWAGPDGNFEDKRTTPGHGNHYYMDFNGYFRHGSRVILDYTVQETRILDSLSGEADALLRTLEVAPHTTELTTTLAGTDSPISISGKGAELVKKDGLTSLKLAPSTETTLLTILYGKGEAPAPQALTPLTTGGHGLYPETFKVQGELGSTKDTWAVDTIPLPPYGDKNPYNMRLRYGDFDFFADGDRAALCTWDGDVWIVSGLKEFKELTWKRFATGLFEPLGLRIVDDVIHVNGRDAIYTLHDLNKDNEADHYKIFNNDVLITDSFHEFSFGLQTDKDGNFYFTKASPVKGGGRGFSKIVPHNGTVIRVSKDGYKLDVIGTGLRAPGGMGVGPDGQVTTGENEGTWQPCCKINYFLPSKGVAFLGVEDAAHSQKGKPLTEPLCYLPMNVDNSGGGQVWVAEGSDFGLKPGELLHLSYGQSSIYRVLPQEMSNGNVQGGVVRLPINLKSSAQRARFNPDGSMYVVGFRGWQTNAATDAAFHRVRYNKGKTIPIPDQLLVSAKGITLRFEAELDPELAEDPSSFSLERWKYIRGPQYGSGQFSIDNPDLEAEKNALTKESKGHKVHDKVTVAAATLSKDKKSVFLSIPDMKPAQQMQINYDLESADGDEFIGTVYNTVHEAK